MLFCFYLGIYHNIYMLSIYSGLRMKKKKKYISFFYQANNQDNKVDLTEAAKLAYDGRESVVGHTLQLIADGLR